VYQNIDIGQYITVSATLSKNLCKMSATLEKE